MRLRDRILLLVSLCAAGLTGYWLFYHFNPYLMFVAGIVLGGLGIVLIVVSIRLAVKRRPAYLAWLLVIAVYFVGTALGDRHARDRAANELSDTQTVIEILTRKTDAANGVPPKDLQVLVTDKSLPRSFDLSRFRYETDGTVFVLHFESIRGPGRYSSQDGEIYWYPW